MGDIDWYGGILLIRAGKTRRERILPLPTDAGAALVRYLKEGRPASPYHRIFLNPSKKSLLCSAIDLWISTGIGAKLDLPSLAQVAIAWLGGAE